MTSALVGALLPAPVLLPLLGAAVTLLLGRHPGAQRVVSLVVLGSVLGVAVALVALTARDGSLSVVVGAWPGGLGIALVADRLSALLLATSASVTALVMVFSVGQGAAADRDDDLPSPAPVSIYHPSFLVLSAGVSLAFLAGDLFNLFVGVEVLLAASYVLITLEGTRARAQAGTTYVVVALTGSFLLLAAVGMVYAATGTLAMADLPARLAELDPALALALEAVLLVAFGIKAAVFPLSAWLPDSYPSAPAPVTAIFAGLLTKVGVYALIRTRTLLFPAPEGADDVVGRVLLVAALATMVVGALGALVQREIKRVLSFTLVSHIGYMLFGLAIGSTLALTGAVFYVVHHIVVQTALFLVVALVAARTGTTSLRRVGGLAAGAPWLGVLFLLPALNLAGIPPFSGFVGKVALLRAGVDDGSPLAWALVVGAVVTSLLTLLAMARVWALCFWSGAAPGREGDGASSDPGGAGRVPVPDGAVGHDGVMGHDGAASPARTGTVSTEDLEETPVTARRLTAGVVLPAAAAVVLTLVLTVGAGPLVSLAEGAAGDLSGGYPPASSPGSR